jgi:hypothetical protein
VWSGANPVLRSGDARADLTRLAAMLDIAQPPLSRQIAFLARFAVDPVLR